MGCWLVRETRTSYFNIPDIKLTKSHYKFAIDKFNQLSTLINVKFKCFFIFHAILMKCEGREIDSSFHILLCVSDVDGQFPFLRIHQLFLSYHFAFGFESLPSLLFFSFVFFFSLIHFCHSTISFVWDAHVLRGSRIFFALVLPSMLWTFVNYYIFIAIQFDSVIYGFQHIFASLFSYFFLAFIQIDKPNHFVI